MLATAGARDFILVETDGERHSLAGKQKNCGDCLSTFQGEGKNVCTSWKDSCILLGILLELFILSSGSINV